MSGSMQGAVGRGTALMAAVGLVSTSLCLGPMAAAELPRPGGLSESAAVRMGGIPERLGAVGVVAVAGGYAHSLALKTDGTVWAWGANYAGQLGDGSGKRHRRPVQVVGLTDVVAIAAGFGSQPGGQE